MLLSDSIFSALASASSGLGALSTAITLLAQGLYPAHNGVSTYPEHTLANTFDDEEPWQSDGQQSPELPSGLPYSSELNNGQSNSQGNSFDQYRPQGTHLGQHGQRGDRWDERSHGYGENASLAPGEHVTQSISSIIPYLAYLKENNGGNWDFPVIAPKELPPN